MRALVEPGPPLTDAEAARYARHLSLPGLGPLGQRRLRAARVLVVGAGGLGSPILAYLGAAGVGRLTVIDDDVVEESNLQRQVLHRAADLGRPKAESAADAVRRLDPAARVTPVVGRLTADNAAALFADHDLVLDGADNFATRYLVADAGELTGTPVVWGTIDRYAGQVSVFWPGEGPLLRDLYPEQPDPDSVPSCAAGGVLGALVGLVGSTMAVEALKVLAGVGEPAVGRLLLIDALAARTRELAFAPDPDRTPATALAEVGAACPATAAPAPEPAPAAVGATALAAELAGPAAPVVVDVRDPGERAELPIPPARPVPLATILVEGWAALAGLPGCAGDRPAPVVLACRSGARSARALAALAADPATPAAAAPRVLAGGALAWAAGPGAG
ncbi:molybdopterin biosynthesis-like protein MoeZ [Corynebacterium sphenisci DSM 44792]|uniref:Molybdopterin biosynthesis-like protein MoeZ n=1 Tax=Corynebacterium sphenisci DSM 44792 TaxID=1437874 RepID=A0A1L7CXP1_9CORY|nr:ThiF family adenylyltransferase [Corynebacterium sphenisci]APT90626.1 molybdopterin biosynthesis-like protein MoeZ [Corynebacterium sphenisci DSM 44792]